MKNLPWALIVCAALVAAAGCGDAQGSDGNPDYKAPSKEEIAAQIKAVDDDPNLPPQAKAIKKAMLQKNGTGQNSMPDKKH